MTGGASIVYHYGGTYGFFMTWQNFSVYILIDLDAMQPLPMLCCRISNVSLNKI